MMKSPGWRLFGRVAVGDDGFVRLRVVAAGRRRRFLELVHDDAAAGVGIALPAEYSHELPSASLAVSSQMLRKSTWAFEFVVASIGGTALCMTPSFVASLFTGPSSWLLPNRSGKGTAPPSGTTPLMLNGFAGAACDSETKAR